MSATTPASGRWRGPYTVDIASAVNSIGVEIAGGNEQIDEGPCHHAAHPARDELGNVDILQRERPRRRMTVDRRRRHRDDHLAHTVASSGLEGAEHHLECPGVGGRPADRTEAAW